MLAREIVLSTYGKVKMSGHNGLKPRPSVVVCARHDVQRSHWSDAMGVGPGLPWWCLQGNEEQGRNELMQWVWAKAPLWGLQGTLGAAVARVGAMG